MTHGALAGNRLARGLPFARRAAGRLAPTWLLVALLAAAPVQAERNYTAFSPKASVAKSSETLSGPAPRAPAVRLPALSEAAIAAMRDENARPGARAMKLGVVRHLADELGGTLPLRDWSATPGGHALRVRIAATAAHALRIGLAVDQAPAGVRVRFASMREPMRAEGRALPRSGSLWSGVIEGEEAIVELFAPESVSTSDVRVSVSAVAQHFVSPLERDFAGLAKSVVSGACEVDFACRAQDDPALARVGAAVARLSYVNGDYVWACTGTLLNPADGSFTPYFQTAAHCVHDQATADTVATLWFYQTSSCGAAKSDGGVQQSGGARLLFADEVLDGALLRLDEAPPAGAAFAGWDSSPLDAGAAITGIHHPGGDVKKVSEGKASLVGAGAFTHVTWISGVTESGSSGSGLFTATAGPQPDYLLRGALFGGMSACTGAPANAYDAYSRLDLLWPKMAPYLGASASTRNYTGVWWNAAEPGWGLHLDHQEGVIFATLFTYDADGQPSWLVASSLRAEADGSFSGALYRTSGPRFDAPSWSEVSAMAVGRMTIAFDDAAQGELTYTVNGTTITKRIAPMVFGGAAPVCTLEHSSRAAEANYQDMWWNRDESGWGLAIAHQGDTLFTVLFTYDDAGHPLWLVAPDVRVGNDGRHSGALYRTSGPAFDAAWKPAGASAVGSLTLDFADGENATLVYSVDGRGVRKNITRMLVTAAGPACH